MVKLLLADDHKIIREGLKAMIKEDPNIEIVAEASNGKEVIDSIPLLRPDVVLMDINMPEMDGVEATKYIHDNHSATKVLVLSMLNQEEKIKEMLSSGAAGYVLKNAGQEELLAAIKIVASGRQYLSTDITLSLLHKMTASSQQDNYRPTPSGSVSKREIEVLKLIADGFTNAQIADKLFNSKRTIESHRRNLLEKTKTKNTAELIKYAIATRLIE